MTYSDSNPITVRGELATVSARLNADSEELVTELANLRQYLDEILAHWRGGANHMFVGLKEEWDFAANGLFNVVLGQISNAMHFNWNNYVDAESANTQTWRQR